MARKKGAGGPARLQKLRAGFVTWDGGPGVNPGDEEIDSFGAPGWPSQQSVRPRNSFLNCWVVDLAIPYC